MDYNTAKQIALTAVSDYNKPVNNHVVGTNFMTPEILKEFRLNNKYDIEISLGTGILSDYIYGVTISKNGKSIHDLSTCVHSGNEITDYIESL
jgi:hypothetical protein